MADTAASKALAPFNKLGRLVLAEVTKAGLRMVGFSIMPGLDNHDPIIRFAVVLNEDAQAPGDPGDDAALAGILMATEEDERAARREKEREKLSKLGDLLKRPGAGFLDEEQ